MKQQRIMFVDISELENVLGNIFEVVGEFNKCIKSNFNINGPSYLTTTQAAKYIGKSPAFIRTHKDELGYYTISGTDFLFKREDLDNFMKARYVKPILYAN